MVSKNKKRRMITIPKELDILINMRGGNKYIIHCLKEMILNHETPNYYELEVSCKWDIYERTALHCKGGNWSDKLFGEGVFKNDKSKK